MAGKSVIGVWTAASRRRASSARRGRHGTTRPASGSQVSRLGNPLFNEVIVPMGDKDRWNARRRGDAQFVKYVAHPELAATAVRCCIRACSRTWRS